MVARVTVALSKMRVVAVDVFRDECSTDRARGEGGVIAFEAAPFGEVICQIKCCGRGRGVFVVDESDVFDVRVG